MFAAILKFFLGDKNQKDIAKINPLVDEILSEQQQLKTLTLDQLREKTLLFKEKIKSALQPITEKMQLLDQKINQTEDLLFKKDAFEQLENLEKEKKMMIDQTLNQILPAAFALMKETTARFSAEQVLSVQATDFDRICAQKYPELVQIKEDQALWQTSWKVGGHLLKWNMQHYPVQLIGGIVLHQGKISEMQTGEGKTFVATLPVYLNALSGMGVHLVTVNDYLAKRDAQWMGPLYLFHGLSVDCIELHAPNSIERKKAYQADITFGTNNEFGFDYLRDNMATDLEALVQRPHHFAIVDEVDSVLIDEARTPLIISGPVQGGTEIEHYRNLKDKVEMLVRSQQRVINELLQQAKKILQDRPLHQLDKKDQDSLGEILLKCHRGMPKNRPFIKLLSEMGVKALLQKTENFYLQEHGKEMPKIDASLYFVLSEKQNSIDLTEKGIELVSKDVEKDFFLLPEIGVLIGQIDQNQQLIPEEKIAEKEKLMQQYKQKSERIHCMSQLLKAYTLFEKDKEYVVLNNKVMIVDEQTGRMMEGRRYSDGLHQAIEAKESVKIEASSQTYASITLQNYFRMYHKLAGMTGTAKTELAELWEIYKLDVVAIPTHRPVLRKDHEDQVYKTIREKYQAIIQKIEEVRKQERACLVGTTSVETSELLSRMLKQAQIPHQVLNAKQHEKEAEIVAKAGQMGAITIATNMAGRGTDIKLSSEVKEKGGLVIIGTERHESRRIDLQLKGRAGRQGDPGDAYFFVSLEDDLMRMFGSERIAGIMDRLGLKEGEVIQHGMISKSIERAQKKVEENNFGIRKRLLEYDNVMNAQREIIYKRRKNALYQKELEIDMLEMFDVIAQQMAKDIKKENDSALLDYLLHQKMGMKELHFEKTDLQKMSLEVLQKQLQAHFEQHYILRKKELAKTIFELFQKIPDLQKIDQALIPFTDGEKGIQIPVKIQEALASQGQKIVLDLEQIFMISTLDFHWKEHLRKMDDLRSSVQMAVHEQKDPLLSYKFQAFEAFEALMYAIYQQVARFIVFAQIPVREK